MPIPVVRSLRSVNNRGGVLIKLQIKTPLIFTEQTIPLTKPPPNFLLPRIFRWANYTLTKLFRYFYFSFFFNYLSAGLRPDFLGSLQNLAG